MLNPDLADNEVTTTIVDRLGLECIETAVAGAELLHEERSVYDCIWSLSVVEHIDGDYDDTEAVRYMYDALRNGGRLILTVPVDREFCEEFRDRPYYVEGDGSRGRFFFQRVYDEKAIRDRLVSPLNRQPSVIRWFGELERGRYEAYELDWLRRGHACTVDDPREIAAHYTEYRSWKEMPGRGVCGLMIEKSREDT